MSVRMGSGGSRRRRIVGAVAAILVGGTVARGEPNGSGRAAAGSTGGAKATSAAADSFEAFSLIGNLNIFDSSRVGWNPGTAASAVDTIALVGTLESGAGWMAFFESPNRLYRKALREGGTIAQFTVRRIEPDRVELAHETQVISLAVRQQLRRPAGGDWSAGDVPLGPVAPSAAAPAASGSASAPPIPSDASDVLKRLMEQRQQQLKQ
jgi:hypothetical protein